VRCSSLVHSPANDVQMVFGMKTLVKGTEFLYFNTNFNNNANKYYNTLISRLKNILIFIVSHEFKCFLITPITGNI